MKKLLALLTIGFIFAFGNVAEAKQRKIKILKVNNQIESPQMEFMFPFAKTHDRPNFFIKRALGCAINVNAYLESKGIKGSGSAMAKSFLSWGRSTQPVAGAVAVYNRGGKKGHVAVVSRVENGVVYVWNPGRNGWQEKPYHKRAIDYRVASL